MKTASVLQSNFLSSLPILSSVQKLALPIFSSIYVLVFMLTALCIPMSKLSVNRHVPTWRSNSDAFHAMRYNFSNKCSAIIQIFNTIWYSRSRSSLAMLAHFMATWRSTRYKVWHTPAALPHARSQHQQPHAPLHVRLQQQPPT